MRFLFPFSDIPKGCNIVLYGAGEVGYDFYRQVKTSGFVQLILWVDRQFEWFRKLNLPVDDPERISDVDYDYVIITAENRSVYESIRKDLLHMNVHEEKIQWYEDYSVHENVVYGYEDRDISAEAKDAILTDAADFLNENRLDIIIRYMYALEILEGVESGYGKCLYDKFIEVGSHAKEPTENYISAYFSEYSCKRGINAFRKEFVSLIHSMRDDGFKKEQFVPVDSKGRLINGAHRVAAALACGSKVWYVVYSFGGLTYICNDVTLESLGFMPSEIEMIKDCYRKVKGNV